MPRPVVYLLHFSEPYRHARHYLGFTKLTVEERLDQHRRGIGARLTQVVVEAGIQLELARVWKGKGRTFERHLKNKGGAARICPTCIKAARDRKIATDPDFYKKAYKRKKKWAANNREKILANLQRAWDKRSPYGPEISSTRRVLRKLVKEVAARA